MKIVPYIVPNPVPESDSALPEDQLKGWFLTAIAQETDSVKRRSLENAAAALGLLMDELQTYRDAAQYDFDRPKSMQFRGWNMGKLAEALKKTKTAQSS